MPIAPETCEDLVVKWLSPCDPSEVDSILGMLKGFHVGDDHEELVKCLRDDAIFRSMFSVVDSSLHGALIKLRCGAVERQPMTPSESGVVHVPDGGKFYNYQEMKWYHYVPLMNILLEGIGNTPKLEDVYNLLNLLLLVDALLLGSAVGFPSVFGYDDLISAVQRFNSIENGGTNETQYYHEWCVDRYKDNEEFGAISPESCGWNLVIRYTAQGTEAIALLGGATLGALFTYACLCISDWTGPSEDSPEKMMYNWWKSAQFGIYFSVTLTVMGIFSCFGAVRYMGLIRYPDYFLDYSGEHKFRDSCGDDARCAGDFISLQIWIYCLGGFFVSVLCNGIGLTLKTRFLVNDIKTSNLVIAAPEDTSTKTAQVHSASKIAFAEGHET